MSTPPAESTLCGGSVLHPLPLVATDVVHTRPV